MQTPDLIPIPSSSEELDYLLSHYDAGAKLLAEANGMLDSIQPRWRWPRRNSSR